MTKRRRHQRKCAYRLKVFRCFKEGDEISNSSGFRVCETRVHTNRKFFRVFFSIPWKENGARARGGKQTRLKVQDRKSRIFHGFLFFFFLKYPCKHMTNKKPFISVIIWRHIFQSVSFLSFFLKIVKINKKISRQPSWGRKNVYAYLCVCALFFFYLYFLCMRERKLLAMGTFLWTRRGEMNPRQQL